MRLSLINKVIAPFLLVVFTITSCNVFVMPEPDTVTVPIGKGDIRFVYLDEDYRPTINDIGKMAMYVENNELTKDVLVLAEIRNDNIDNDIVVRVMNKQNNSLVSFFYFRGQYFPHKVAITIDGETITGQFSLYSSVSETYSVAFTPGEAESENYSNFILNKKVFSLHKKDNALTDTQNIRISHIITTLALWNSLAFQLDKNFKVGGRDIVWEPLSKIFTVIAVVAVTAVVILAPPEAVVARITISASADITERVIDAGLSIASEAAAVITGIPFKVFDAPEQKQPPPNEGNCPTIKITLIKDNEEITLENNGTPSYYFLNKGESLTFNLKITDCGSSNSGDIIDKVGLISWFDPNIEKFIDMEIHNAVFFGVNIEDAINDILRIVVGKIHSGSFDDGRVQLVLRFGRDVIINGKGDGIDFWDDNDNPVEVRKDIFVINLKTNAL